MSARTLAIAPISFSVLTLFAGCVNADDKPPALQGTYWQLLSLTKKGEKVTDAQNPADVEFLKDNKWGILHYGGRREAGTYQVTGDRLIMKNESGETYHDAKMKWNAESKILSLDSGEYLMRLKQVIRK